MIPFNKPSFQGNELEYISDAISRGHISGDGHYTKLCSKLLQDLTNSRHCLLTTSCTDALEMASILLDIQPGDEVLIPSFTFVSTVNAFILRGATPVFLDIRPDTLNVNESTIEAKITSRTKAIVPVHYAGVGCEMEQILSVAHDHGISVVEDNAHGLFGKYRGRNLGTFGRLATQSFHETKNITCGEGGALLINDIELFDRAEILRDKGTNRKQFFRGQVDKYNWVDLGSSYLPSDILSAFLLAQLEKSELIQSQRKIIWNRYYEHLAEWAKSHDVNLPYVPEHCEQAYHMFYIICPDINFRTKLIQFLKDEEIYSVFHYTSLHLSPMGIKFGGKPGDCPVTESVSDRLLRLPFYTSMSLNEVDKVINRLTAFKPNL